MSPKPRNPKRLFNPSPNTPRKTMSGRVVGPEDRPVAGATVTIARYRRAATDLYFSGTGPWNPNRQELDRCVSDQDGRFQLTFENWRAGLG